MTTEMGRPTTAEDLGTGGLQLRMVAGPAAFVVDELIELGGLDLGPTPHELVQAALASCTLQTIRMYAKRKSWALGAVRAEVILTRNATRNPPDHFVRTITLPADLPGDQRARLLEIAEMCPIHRMLTRGATVETKAA